MKKLAYGFGDRGFCKLKIMALQCSRCALSGLTLILVLNWLLCGCSTIGLPDKKAFDRIDFGPEEILRTCILQDEGISDADVTSIIEALQKEFAIYGIIIEVPEITAWKRPGFSAQQIYRDVLNRELKPPCDRLFALVGRDARDFAWGLFLPEYLGAVDERTMTKGFAVAQIGSLNQALAGMDGPKSAIHEMYHMLGCDHGPTLAKCYKQIRHIKALARMNRRGGEDFFPGTGLSGKIYLHRDGVNIFEVQVISR